MQDTAELGKKLVSELKEIAKTLGIEVTEKMKKQEIIQKISTSADSSSSNDNKDEQEKRPRARVSKKPEKVQIGGERKSQSISKPVSKPVSKPEPKTESIETNTESCIFWSNKVPF